MKSKKLKQAYDALISGIPVLMCTPQEAKLFFNYLFSNGIRWWMTDYVIRRIEDGENIALTVSQPGENSILWGTTEQFRRIKNIVESDMFKLDLVPLNEPVFNY